jgi:hypothetical protein
MVVITFPDRDTEKKALGFLLGRFSRRVLSSGEHLVPEAALEALAVQNIPFTVKGKATYEQLASLRDSDLPPITKALRGSLKNKSVDEKDYKKYLENKHF